MSYFADPATLPPGLRLGQTGALLGSPTTKGLYTFTVRANNFGNQNGFATVTVGIGTEAPIVSQAPLAKAKVGEPYRGTIRAIGVPTPTFGAIDPTKLPAGLILTTAGELTGTQLLRAHTFLMSRRSTEFCPMGSAP
jgi:large repetitive protein